MLDFALFTRVIDEAGPALDRVDFFNYGETFLHKRAVEMCEYIKQRFPRIYLYTSTNGLALTEAQATRLVHSGIDEVTFSVDGAFPESYARYRRRGRLDAALHTMRAMTREKRRAGRDLPFINWRYILFKWNDSTEEMRHARKLADEIGVDRLTWEITDHPESAFSRRFAPGTPDHAAIRNEIWDENNLGNAIPEATPRARIDLHSVAPRLPLIGRRGSRLRLRASVRNLSSRPFPAQATYGRRLVRLGAQLCTSNGVSMLSRARIEGRARPPRGVNPYIRAPAPTCTYDGRTSRPIPTSPPVSVRTDRGATVPARGSDGRARRTRRPANPCTCRARSMTLILCGGLRKSGQSSTSRS